MTRRQQLLAMAVCYSLLSFFAVNGLCGEKSRLISNLKAGKKQTVVTYGTSLTADAAWVGQLSEELNRRYPGLTTVINSGQAAMWSTWGLENLDYRVISKKPDTVFVEFSINDAFLPYRTTVPQARSNLVTMIDRLIAANKSCEIILMVMNPLTGVQFEARPHIGAYNQMYRDVAAERHLMLIDHYPTWEKLLKQAPNLFSQYIPDGIHPNAKGCKVVMTPRIISDLGMGTEPQGRGDADKPRASP